MLFTLFVSIFSVFSLYTHKKSLIHIFNLFGFLGFSLLYFFFFTETISSSSFNQLFFQLHKVDIFHGVKYSFTIVNF